jgi:hypothetical protein
MESLREFCSLQPITKTLIDNCNPFDCGDAGINEFFRGECLDYERERLAKSYCFLLNEDKKVIVAVFSLSNDIINTELLKSGAKKKIRKMVPDAKSNIVRRYPSVLIGQFGVSNPFQRKNNPNSNISEEMIMFIKEWLSEDTKSATRFITLDSKNNQKVIAFYKNNGFEFLCKNEDDEKKYYNKAEDKDLTTRLMFFDLLLL